MKTNKLVVFLCLILTTNFVLAQPCTQDDRYTTTDYFSDAQIDSAKGVTYGSAIDYLGESQDLKMDFYFPKNEIDSAQKRPFILLIHGGGFYGGAREGYAFQATEFAKRGFVVASMSYRLGFDRENPAGIQKAVYRAQQDADSALNYVASQADEYNIDTSWFFVGGSSAGAITSLFVSYANQAEWNQVIPAFEGALGPLKLVDDANQSFKIKGIYNFMGSLQPIAFKEGDLIPMVSFHGDQDQTVPFGKSIYGYGSKPIHDMLTQAGVCNNLTVVQGGGHDIYRSKEDNILVVNRVSEFFKSLICDTCTSIEITDQVNPENKGMSAEILNAIKAGNTEQLDGLIDLAQIDKCHDIQGGLYNYLACSVKLESIESFTYFVNKEADLEGNCTGKTPLMYAAKYGMLDAIKLLLKKGADINYTNDGKSALDYATNYGHTQIKEYLENYKTD